MIDREKVIKGLEFTKAMITFNPSTGEDIKPENLNEENKTTYDACVGAIALLKEQEPVKPKKGLFHMPTTILFDYECECGVPIMKRQPYCMSCGKAVKWDD